jgi:hypothetical protein
MIKGKIGFEFEGFIPYDNAEALKQLCRRKNINFESDESVGYTFRYILEGIARSREAKNENELKKCYGEEQFRAIELNGRGLIFDIEKINSVFLLAKKIFNMGFRVNSSCGLHIHLSFQKEADYFKLLNWDFIKQFQEKIRNIFLSDYEKLRLIAFYSKEYADNTEFESITTRQIRHNGKCAERYFNVNFNSYNIYHTIEFRIFPATSDILNLKKYVGFLLQNAEEFLTQHNKIELKEEFKIKNTARAIKVYVKKINNEGVN